MLVSYRIRKRSLVDMTLFVDSRSKFRLFSVTIGRPHGGLGVSMGVSVIFLRFSPMLISLVYSGILLLVVVSLMGEMARLIRGHWGQGACIMGHVNGFFHGSGTWTTPWLAPSSMERRGRTGIHGLSVWRHAVQGMARRRHEMRWWRHAVHHVGGGAGGRLSTVIPLLLASTSESAGFHAWRHAVTSGGVTVHHGSRHSQKASRGGVFS